MHIQNFLRNVLFMFFFAVGTAALSVSILSDMLVEHYKGKQVLEKMQLSVSRLKSLNEDYDALLKRLQSNPDAVELIVPATLGTEPNDANSVYPSATPQSLAAARKALMKDLQQQREDCLPVWLSRCSTGRYRKALFLSGTALILLSFVCFNHAKSESTKQKTQIS